MKVLFHHPAAKVRFPTHAAICGYERAIQMKYNLLPNVWGAMDGVKLLLEKSGDDTMQNNFFNGWTHDHYVSNLFLFAPDGLIRGAYVNAPGVLHDSTLENWGHSTMAFTRFIFVRGLVL